MSIHSGGRLGPGPCRPFSPAEIQQIARTVRRTPEVMLKVTGGGTKVGAVAAHFDYISRHGELEIETDDGANAQGRDDQKEMLKNWHLDLTAAHYRRPRRGQEARDPKMVYNIVLSMPAPTPPEKVLAASRKFARERFGARHRYAMVLHTDQANPHVHLVVKAEDEQGRRFHVDKEMLRHWREDFAQLMREQGVAANATSRLIRGRDNPRTKNSLYHVRREGDASRRTATGLPPSGVSKERLLSMRKWVMAHWRVIASSLDEQGEIQLAGDVRYFAQQLPVLSADQNHSPGRAVRAADARKSSTRSAREPTRHRDDDLVR